MLSSRSPWRKYMELRPLSPLVRPVVPDGGVNNVTAGCSVSASHVCCALTSKCTRVHTTSARLQSILGTPIVLQALSVRTRNKICWGRVLCAYAPNSCVCAHAYTRCGGCGQRRISKAEISDKWLDRSSSCSRASCLLKFLRVEDSP